MTGAIIFADPPTPNVDGPEAGSMSRWLHDLRSHRHRWAMWPERVHPNRAVSITRGVYHGTRLGEFQAVCIGILPGAGAAPRGDLYVRFVGEPEA